MDLLKLIQNTHHFPSLTEQEAEKLIAASVKTELKKGEILIRGGQKSDYIYLVASGLLRIDAEHSSGKSCTVVFLPPGLVTDGELSGRSPNQLTVSAFIDSTVLQVPRALVRQFMLKNERFMKDFMRERDFTMRYAVHFYSSVISSSPNVRLAKLLLTLTFLLCTRDAPVDLEMTNEELASMLGCSRQTTGKIIKEWRSRGLIETGYRNIRIVDIDEMCAMAGWSSEHWKRRTAPEGSWFYRLNILPDTENSPS